MKIKEQKDVILVTGKDLINVQAVPMDTIHVEHVMEMERFLATHVTALERSDVLRAHLKGHSQNTFL